jgi:hypothetical protein
MKMLQITKKEFRRTLKDIRIGNQEVFRNEFRDRPLARAAYCTPVQDSVLNSLQVSSSGQCRNAAFTIIEGVPLLQTINSQESLRSDNLQSIKAISFTFPSPSGLVLKI